MRFRSKKMEAKYRQRRPLVVRILTEFPVCQRCHMRASEEVHEIKSRARGGDILDPNNCAALCHNCHMFITTHPKLATEEGWLKSSWDYGDEVAP